MEPVCDTARVRAAEAHVIATDGADVLMQRAASGLAGVIADLLIERGAASGRSSSSRHSHPGQRLSGATVLVVAGSGNNGGDALFAGARLAETGAGILVVQTDEAVHTEGLRACQAAGGRLVGQAEVGEWIRHRRIDCVVDGVLGLGGRAGLRGPVAALAIACRDGGVPVVAVDLPSGLEADSGRLSGTTFRAQRTVTFGVRKPCHVLEPAASACGEVTVVDIGLGEVPPLLAAATEDDVAAWWPVPDGTSDKYARGVVGLDTGSPQYPGAAVLSAFGATHAGAGMVRFTGADEV
ncbi:MAG: NAD(P)H-hydrate epimerase, partial [Propionibacteriales bacterium]|nr:NAD(P)H-hydrate epimerase [Propionibacteriales bacterium]